MCGSQRRGVRRNYRRTAWAAVALACSAALCPSLAHALINPKYTVVDLARDSSAIYVLRVDAPQADRLTAEIVETLSGDPPEVKQLVLDLADAEDETRDQVAEAFAGAKSTVGVMCLSKRKRAGKFFAFIEIGTVWVEAKPGDKPGLWTLDRDTTEKETVWGGSARFLVPAVRYCLSAPGAGFPVAANMKWGRDLALGKLAGKAYGCLMTADGVIVLCDGGDRLYQPGVKGAPPTDVTEKLGLKTKSKALVAGDFNADGRIDLASWDGEKLWLALRGEDGKFAAPVAGPPLAECLSLCELAGGLVIGTRAGVTLLTPDGSGGWKTQALVGPGGPCAVADFNGDGSPDILQASAEGLTFYAGKPQKWMFAEPVITKLAMPRRTTTIVCGDFDTDGQLDAMVAGEGGARLLTRDVKGGWLNVMAETGELAADGGLSQGEGSVVAACLTDLNGDGRQAVAVFQAAASPGLFFNRGFACFGLARSLNFADLKLPAAAALGSGQATGVVCDLNGDAVPDLLAVDPHQNLWAIFGEAQEARRFQIALDAAGSGPLTVSASVGKRIIGMWVIRAGEPATIHLLNAGKVTLRWKTADGQEAARDVVITGPTRVRLGEK